MTNLHVQTVGSGVLTLNDGKFTEASERFCELLGFEPEQLVGMSWRHVNHPNDWADVERLLSDVRRAGSEAVVCEARRYLGAGGAIQWGYVRVTLLEDENSVFFELEPLPAVDDAMKDMQERVDSLERECHDARERRRLGYAVLDEQRNSIEDELYTLRRMITRLGAALSCLSSASKGILDGTLDLEHLAIVLEGAGKTAETILANAD